MSERDQIDAQAFLAEAQKGLEEAHETAPEGRPTIQKRKGYLFGLIAVVIIGALLYFMGQVTTLTRHRAERDRVDCRIQSNWLGLLPLRERSVRGVQGAQVAENCDQDGCTYRVELRTGGGIVPLTPHYSSGSVVKESVARRVNDFVRDPTAASLQVREHFDPTDLILVALFVGGASLWGRWRRYRASKHEQFVQQVADNQKTTEADVVWRAKLVKKDPLRAPSLPSSCI